MVLLALVLLVLTESMNKRINAQWWWCRSRCVTNLKLVVVVYSAGASTDAMPERAMTDVYHRLPNPLVVYN